MQLNLNEIHVWFADLSVPVQLFLSPDEKERADRFRFPIHKQRFTVARTVLRQILSQYLGLHPLAIKFSYDVYGKPHLHHQFKSHIQFNISHSGTKAVFALTLDYAIGIDIEKIHADYPLGVAKRFFSDHEKNYLESVSQDMQALTFYRIWSRKEAIIKAIGKGFKIPLSSFSVSLNGTWESILLEGISWMLTPFAIHSGYESALACKEEIKKISYWKFSDYQGKIVSIAK